MYLTYFLEKNVFKPNFFKNLCRQMKKVSKNRLNPMIDYS